MCMLWVIFLALDTNECTDITYSHACDDTNSDCFNTEGSYGCVCKDGYTKTSSAAATDNCTGVPEMDLITLLVEESSNCTN